MGKHPKEHPIRPIRIRQKNGHGRSRLKKYSLGEWTAFLFSADSGYRVNLPQVNGKTGK
jgi:hypothetical protein